MHLRVIIRSVSAGHLQQLQFTAWSAHESISLAYSPWQVVVRMIEI